MIEGIPSPLLFINTSQMSMVVDSMDVAKDVY